LTDYFSRVTGTGLDQQPQQAQSDAPAQRDYFSEITGTGLGNIGAPKPPRDIPTAPELPSVFSQFKEDPQFLAATRGGSLLGASDAQLGDIVQKSLGDKFIRREGVSIPSVPLAPNAQPGTRAAAAASHGGDYQVFVTRGPDGKEQRGYLNKPGLDSEDITRAVTGSIPYVATGAGGLVLGAGRGLLANAVIQGGAGALTSAGGDAAMIPMGSEQGIDVPKAIISGAMGAAAPVAGRASGNMAQAASDLVRPLPPELSGLSRGAVRRVARAVGDDHLTPQAYAANAAELGPEGALMDMGDNLRGQAGGIARSPGEGQTILREAARQRTAGAPQRMTDAIDNALGPAQNMIELERNTVDAANAQAGPHYRAFENSDITITPELEHAIRGSLPDRGPQTAVAMLARQPDQPQANALARLLEDPTQPLAGTTATPRELDYLKRHLDAQATAAFAKPETAHLGTLISDNAARLRNEIDRILSPQDPAQSPYAIARETAGTGQQFRQGVTDAHNVFSAPKTHSPDLVADQLAQNPGPTYRAGYTAEARGDLANMMNDARSQFGPTGDRAARAGLWSPNAENKVRQLAASPDAADALLRRRNAETTFAQTQHQIEGNSITAAATAAQKEFPNVAANGTGAGRVIDATWQGVALALARKAANAATNGHLNRQLARMGADAARVLSSTGVQRDAYFAGLTRVLQSRGISAARAQQISRAVEVLVLAERQNVIGGPSTN
jgi:hypothetical protein